MTSAAVTAPVASRPAVAAEPARALGSAPRLRDLALAPMLDVLDRLVPQPLVRRTADGTAPIVAVVGDPSVARAVAATVARRGGGIESDVLVASPSDRDDVAPWLRIDSAATAAARVARWRRGEHPVVVAVDLTPGRDGHQWAADLLAAIGADEVRLVARAWQVTDELAPKAAVLGGIDGLELVEAEAAAEPETFLDLDLPVLGIDGRPATPELWAALLMERRNDVAL